MKDLYSDQIEFDDEGEYENAVRNAMSVKALNQLRMAGVKFRNPVLTILWQERYWAFKNCPGCAKAKYDGGKDEI